MSFETYVCDDCGLEIEAACLLELQRKKRTHKCQPTSKRVLRTKAFQQQQGEQFIQDLTADRLAQHNFDRLVQQGMVVAAR